MLLQIIMGNFPLHLFLTSIYSSVIFAYPTDVANVKKVQNLNVSAKICDGELNLSNLNLATFSKAFVSGSSITKVSMTHSNIQEINEGAFDNLPRLEDLNLSYNSLPASELFSFGEIPSLKRLTLDYNYYDEETYPEPDYWTENYIIYFNKNHRLQVPYNYPEINFLSLRGCSIKSISVDWEMHFPKLEHLDLSKNHFWDAIILFDNIPSNVTTLILEEADLSYVYRQTPSNIVRLQLNHNRFQNLSIDDCYNADTLCLKNFQALKFLYISNCSIESINSNAFSELPNLISLDMSYNKFTEIPEDTFNGTSLQYLDLSGNALYTIDFTSLDELRTLKMNDIKSNNIISLLEYIPVLINLETLELKFNSIRTVSYDALMKFPNLKLLNLSANSIRSLPFWEWQYQLHSLYLSLNNIRYIEDLSLRNATSLGLIKLEGNLITTIKISDIKYLSNNWTITL